MNIKEIRKHLQLDNQFARDMYGSLRFWCKSQWVDYKGKKVRALFIGWKAKKYRNYFMLTFPKNKINLSAKKLEMYVHMLLEHFEDFAIDKFLKGT